MIIIADLYLTHASAYLVIIFDYNADLYFRSLSPMITQLGPVSQSLLSSCLSLFDLCINYGNKSDIYLTPASPMIINLISI